MSPKHIIFSIALLAVLLLGLGCEDRGTGIPTASDFENFGDWPAAQHSFDSLLTLQLGNPDELLLASGYIPRQALFPPTGPGLPTPVLILLPPQDGDHLFYKRAGLVTLAQELIASGEIDPMIIYCPSNALAFGGMFYGSSDAAGYTDLILKNEMLEFLFSRVPSSDSTRRRKHGIGGIGMGAYGAMRAALIDTVTGSSLYGSVSAVTGPLDFDGAGNGGLTTLFGAALAEQQTLTRYTPQIGDTFTYRNFDSGDVFVSLPLSRMFIGGSVAFSPHDDSIFWTWNFTEPLSSSTRAVITSRLQMADSTTLIDSLVGRGTARFGYHLPFDSLGVLDTPTWSRWMRNNLDSLFLAGGGTQLDSTDVWIANNPNGKWNYSEMTTSFINFLKAQNGDSSVTVFDYTGLGDPSSDNVHDILKEMLIFHSNSFKD